MKALIVLAAALSICTSALASETVTCEGPLKSGTHAAFEMTGGTATLAFDYREFIIDMDCREYAADLPVLVCVENIPGDHKYVVQLANGQAHVSLEATNPHATVYKGALNCK